MNTRKPPRKATVHCRVCGKRLRGVAAHRRFCPDCGRTRTVILKKERYRREMEGMPKRRPGRPSPFPLDARISVLIGENPKLPFTKQRRMFDLYQDGMTVEEAFGVGFTSAMLRYDKERGYIEIE